MNTPNQTPNMHPAEMNAVTISAIELLAPSHHKLSAIRRYQVEASIDGALHQTQVTEETRENHISWDENMFFDGNDQSTLLVQVYRHRRFKKDQLVGYLSETIGYILGKLSDGMFEQRLSKDPTTAPDPSGVTLKFKLTAKPVGTVRADERQADDAVARVKDGVNMLIAPALVDHVASGVDTTTTVLADVQTFDNTWDTLLQRMELFDKIVTGIAEIHPYMSLAWSVISAANKILVNQKNRDDQMVRLAGSMADVFEFVKDAQALKTIEKHMKTITLLIRQVAECGYFIAEYAKQKNFWTRTAMYTLSDIDGKITEYQNKFVELKGVLLEGLALRTGVTVIRMMNVVEHAAEAIDLNDMSYAFGARYAQEKGCLTGTRESFLRDICDVLNNPDEDAPQVCLLTGVAGSGKSAVAHSVARLYDEQQRLGSSYCFSSSDVTRRNPQNLFSTIARDLADKDPQYKFALWTVVKDNRSLRTSTSPSEQVEKLIIEPRECLHTIGPLVIVIDALDESGSEESRRQILEVLSKQISKNSLPRNLRFLITARPESDILTAFVSTSCVIHRQMGNIPEEEVNQDIEKFIQHSLRHQSRELECSWPNKEWSHLLVHHSRHLFQWAATACKFLQGIGTKGLRLPERMKRLIENNVSIHPLDELYQTILSQLFTLDETYKYFQDVMAIVLALKEPLSLRSLTTLFAHNPNLNIKDIIQPMGSLLDGVLDEDKPIQPLHISFYDFLLDETRSASFCVHIRSYHSLSLGQALLGCMKKMLKFNMCNLKDAQQFNSVVPGLSEQVKEVIPPYLAYSCQYWMVHLGQVECSKNLLEEVTIFFKTFFPYWLEAISLLSTLSPLLFILSAMKTCNILKVWAKGNDISILASEAFQFIQVFAPVLERSTPHLYLSAMPQTPSGSPLTKLWVDHLQEYIGNNSDCTNTWPAEVLHIQGHSAPVSSVAYSPDGTHIASGSWNGTIKVWNASTGQLVAGPFEGHISSVNSVAYSPDGTCIVSSGDITVRVWNASTGQLLACPFEGHSKQVKFVSYSPNGTHIVSGSEDKTIRIWNASTGQLVTGPFKGHLSSVNSVVYSPDGAHIVSGSRDKTIRVWNVFAGQLVVGPLEGHSDSVSSVTYSPDGTQIVSGSWDNTIRVWNAFTGQLVAGPFVEHSLVFSVAYSPDGAQIVSGSGDKTIRVWSASSGQLVAGPFEGHSHLVFSVAYSPDGTQIVSGSWDTTIRVWNASTGQLTADSSKGHSDSVYSVAYSPDGTKIISGSWDKTIRVWSASTGQLMADPFKGHSNLINCVSYSPDGTQIVSGSWDKTVMVWSMPTGQLMAGPFEGHLSSVNSVAYSSDGIHVASGSSDTTIRVWNSSIGQFVAGPFVGHMSSVTSIAYSPDGAQIVSGSHDSTVRIWNAFTGFLVAGPIWHSDSVNSVAYSPDGIHIASGSLDRTVRVWNASTGQLVAGPFEGHSDSVNCVAYSPNGTQIVSGSGDKTIRVWNASTGQLMAGPFCGHSSAVMSVAYSPNGKYIVSGSRDHSVKIWMVESLISWGGLIQQNGWILSLSGDCFGWIVQWKLDAVCLPVHSLVISSKRSFQHNIDTSLCGESWELCWKSA